jgi:hypothetical protein
MLDGFYQTLMIRQTSKQIFWVKATFNNGGRTCVCCKGKGICCKDKVANVEIDYGVRKSRTI